MKPYLTTSLTFFLLISAGLLALTSTSFASEPEGDLEQFHFVSGHLSNQHVTAMAEDAQGHLWLGTMRGLNKHVVYEYHQYFSTENPLGLPDNQVNDLLRDQHGRLWVATANGTAQLTDQDSFRRVTIDFPNQNGMQLVESSDGHIFLNMVTQLCAYNSEADQLECVIEDFDPWGLFVQTLHADQAGQLWAVSPVCVRGYDATTMILRDSIPIDGRPQYAYLHPTDGLLWLAGAGSLETFDTRRRQMRPLPTAIAGCAELMHSTVVCIHPYAGGLLLATAHAGMWFYSPQTETVIRQDEPGFPLRSAPRWKVSRMMTDSRGNLWMGSVDQGYMVAYRDRGGFSTDSRLAQATAGRSVTAMAREGSDRLWLVTLTDGLLLHNLNNGTTECIALPTQLGEGTPPEVEHIMVDDEGRLWLALGHGGLACCHRRAGQVALTLDALYDIDGARYVAQDRRGTLWVGTNTSTVYALRQGAKEWQAVEVFDDFWFTFVPCLLPLDDGRVMAVAFYRPIRLIDPDDWSVSDLEISAEDMQVCIRRSLLIPTAICQDSRGDIWLGTITNGLLRLNAGTGHLERMWGLACTDISAIEEDQQGHIWVSTLYGLSRYDRTVERWTTFFEEDGTGGNQFYERAACRLDDGTLVFGGTHGVTYFNPIDVQTHRQTPLLFETLKIHNRLTQPGDGQPIARHLSYNPDIYLTHNQNGFSISFAALDYAEHERVRYFYKMEGVDRVWVDAASNREAYYANLGPGHYTFRVRVTNADESQTEAERSIRVIVHPAPWNTWWAWCAYAFLAALVVGLLVRGALRIRREKLAARRAREAQEQEQRLNRMNMRFFTNVAHEFRTPLTMIAGPVAQLCESATVGENDRRLLRILHRSVDRLLRLVGQLLDFNRLEDDKLRLQVSRRDIVAPLRRLVDTFEVNARLKGITLSAEGLTGTCLIWLDADKLDKIMTNLLGNALKYTPQGGHIRLSLAVDKGLATVTVADTGPGILDAEKERIFGRYYQLEGGNGANSHWGTGIGLYYARGLAQLHHGHLSVSDPDEGTGSVFTLALPTNDDVYTERERAKEEQGQEQLYPLTAESSSAVAGPSRQGGLNKDTAPSDTTSAEMVSVSTEMDNVSRGLETVSAEWEDVSVEDKDNSDKILKTVAVIDDDPEVTHYLQTLLSPHYRTVSWLDADQALEALPQERADLVLSDVVMPHRSGYDLCRAIKEDMNLCHLPVVLLTARTAMDAQVEGLDAGADAYVTKPFDPRYLLALIASLIRGRELARRQLSQSTQVDRIDQEALNPADRAFMNDLYRLMESELSNPELNVGRLAELLCMSRTKFYLKVKALTGESPSTFFKTYKLNRAAELMGEGRYNVSEIADLTGFSTLAHFSTSFKRQFGVSPSAYRGT